MNSVEALKAISDLLDAVPGGYVSKAKVRALLTRQAEAADGHEGHDHLLVGSMLVCGCGKDIGVVSINVDTNPPQIQVAYLAAWGAYADKLRELANLGGDSRQPFVLNIAIADAVDAALRVYGVEP